MHLLKTDDPRDELAKATRDELWLYAEHKGVVPDMLRFMNTNIWTPDYGFVPKRPPGFVASQANVTKDDIANWLRNMGYTGLRAAERIMGRPVVPTQFDDTSLVHDSSRDYPGPRGQVDLVPVEAMTLNELRAECKARGIPMIRTDNKETLRAKIAESIASGE